MRKNRQQEFHWKMRCCTPIFQRVVRDVKFVQRINQEPRSTVSIVSDYGLDGQGMIPDRGRGFFF
jgi:hypothetical protein